MPRNDGSAAEKAFKAWVNNHGKRGYIYEFPDTKKIKGMLGKKGITLAQPADNLVCVDGELFFAEVKSTEHKTRFNKSHIRPEQWKTAVMVTAAGGPYFFFIRRETDQQWFRVPARYLVENNRPSWTWEELTPFEWSISK